MRVRKEEKKRSRIFLKLLIVIVLVFIVTLVLKVAPNYIKDKNQKIRLVINYQDVTNFLKSDVFIDENKTIYLSKEDIANFYDEFIYYDEKYNQIITTSVNNILVMKLNSNEKEINGELSKLNNEVLLINNRYYIPFSELESIYNVKATYIESNNTVVLDSIDRQLKQVECINNTNIKYKSTIFSKTIEKLEKGEKLIVAQLTEEQEKSIPNDWIKVRTEKGNLGYVKKDSVENETIVREEKKEEKDLKEKVSLVWEYFSEYYMAPNRTGTTIEGVNVVSPSFFYLEKLGKGNLLENVKNSGENYINWAHINGYKVWPVVSNNSMKETTSEIMNDYELRKKLIDQIVEYVNKYNLDGINIDFEHMEEEDKEMFSRFIIELTPRIKKLGKVVSVDVTAPDGSPDWSLCFDRNTLGKVVDYVMFMAYDQYGESSIKAGTTAGYDWVKLNINKFINQEEVPKEKLVLGIPFYTRLWQERDGNLTSKPVTMKEIDNTIPNDVQKQWDDNLKQYYVEYEKNNVIYKMWIEDEESIKEKMSLVNEFNLAGGCYWVKDYETEGVWGIIKEALKE